MAVTTSTVQVLWSGAATKSIAAAGNATSDAFTIDAACIRLSAMCYGDNGGTPASGDTATFYLLPTLGDPLNDPDSSDVYATTTQGILLGVIDTFITDPAAIVVEVNAAIKGGKIYAVNNIAATRAIVVSVQFFQKLS